MVTRSPSSAQPQIGAAISRCSTMLSVNSAGKRTFACAAGARANTAARIHRDVCMGINSQKDRGGVNPEASKKSLLGRGRRGIYQIERLIDQDFTSHFAERRARDVIVSLE